MINYTITLNTILAFIFHIKGDVISGNIFIATATILMAYKAEVKS